MRIIVIISIVLLGFLALVILPSQITDCQNRQKSEAAWEQQTKEHEEFMKQLNKTSKELAEKERALMDRHR